MNRRLATLLGGIPLRQLYMALGGVLAISAVLLLAALRLPFITLQAAHAERIQHQKSATDSALLDQVSRQMAADIKLMSVNAATANGKRTPDQIVVDVVGELNRTSVRRGVVLSRVVPGVARRILMFNEIPFDVEISGSYRDAIGWLQDLEANIAALSVSSVEVRRNEPSEVLTMKIRIAVYREVENSK